MSYTFSLSDEHLDELERLLSSIVEKTAVEVHRTEAFAAKLVMERRYKVQLELLDQIRRVRLTV